MSVVAPTEADLAVLASEYALVGDGDPMRVTPEVGEDLPGTAEGGFGVDHLVLRPELGEERPEGRSIGEGVVSPAKSSFPASEACRSASKYFARKTIESARTGKRKPHFGAIHCPSDRVPRRSRDNGRADAD